MKLKKIFALCISAALMLTGCIQKNDAVELSEEEKEHNAVMLRIIDLQDIEHYDNFPHKVEK